VTHSGKRVARTSSVLDMRNGNSHEIVVVTKELKTEKPVD